MADLFVLFPHGRISDVQRRMMTTASEENVHAIAIEGTFDDCQAIVKAMFNHHGFRDRTRLSGVNSINWARIAAQAVYYFTAAVALGAPHRKVAFTVPTGNLGDLYAGYVALRMGLPIERLVAATNVNDIIPRTLATGSYEPRPVVATVSPIVGGSSSRSPTGTSRWDWRLRRHSPCSVSTWLQPAARPSTCATMRLTPKPSRRSERVPTTSGRDSSEERFNSSSTLPEAGEPAPMARRSGRQHGAMPSRV